MRALIVISSALLVMGCLSSCQNAEQKQAQDNADALSAYVDSVSKETPVYTEAQWKAINAGYQEREDRVQATAANMDDKCQAKVSEAKTQYATLRTSYTAKIKEEEDKKAAASDPKNVLRSALFGEGKIGSDVSFSWVNAENILSVYQRFVNAVEENQNKYSREDWDEIKALWEALDTRKNTVEKEGLAPADNTKIAGLKVKFGAIKSIKRPFAKVKENEDAKQ